MHDVMDIAAVPAYEEPEPANVKGANYTHARIECRAFMHQLRRVFGTAPEGAELFVHHNRDGNDGYYEVAVRYDTENRPAIDYAFKLEAEMPAYWDTEAIKELQEAGLHVKDCVRS